MKKFDIFYILYLLVIAIIAISVFLFSDKIFTYKKSSGMLSPLPNFLTGFINNQVSTLNLWFPSPTLIKKSGVREPDLSATSAVLYDLVSNKVLYSKNPDLKLPMASLTKIMTAIIAIENKKPDDRYLVTTDDLVGEDSMGLSAGEVLSLEDLLYGLILHSGNDAAETLASNYSYGRKGFIQAMNEKAKSLGLSDTNFTNPTGLEGDGKQYTTANDLLVITNYALKKPLFQEVVSQFDYHIPYSSEHKEYYLENETNLLTSYPGVLGVKTGYTPEAGLCLVTYLNYSGHKIIGILLDSDNRRQEMKDLLDYGLRVQGINPPSHG